MAKMTLPDIIRVSDGYS